MLRWRMFGFRQLLISLMHSRMNVFLNHFFCFRSCRGGPWVNLTFRISSLKVKLAERELNFRNDDKCSPDLRQMAPGLSQAWVFGNAPPASSACPDAFELLCVYVLIWWWFSKSSFFGPMFFPGRNSDTSLYHIYYFFPFLETEKNKWKKQELLSQWDFGEVT